MDDFYLPVGRDGMLCVPDTPASLTTYVLIEHGDWFEREIAFVRRVMRPGMRALDVGANYGVYTLALARAAGATGAVWSFEPASTTADYLRRTIARNKLTNVHLRQAALSGHRGEGKLSIASNSELNRLSDAPGAGFEQVELSTLDHEEAECAWGRIDFVKLDAEGEEVNILAGGEAFFAGQSPLVMFEFQDSGRANAPLLAAFAERGYGAWRLVGPDRLLVPLTAEDPGDEADLNLFACKPDRAAALAEGGNLVEHPVRPTAEPGIGLAFWRRQVFAASFARGNRESDAEYLAALDLYALWRDESRGLSERYGALRASLSLLKACSGQRATRLVTLARLAIETGRRKLATQTLSGLLDIMPRGVPRLDEPFWPPVARFDRIAATDPAWLFASVVEAYELVHAHSGCFVEPKTLPLLEWLRGTRFATPAMERRRLLKSRVAESRVPAGPAKPG